MYKRVGKQEEVSTVWHRLRGTLSRQSRWVRLTEELMPKSKQEWPTAQSRGSLGVVGAEGAWDSWKGTEFRKHTTASRRVGLVPCLPHSCQQWGHQATWLQAETVEVSVAAALRVATIRVHRGPRPVRPVTGTRLHLTHSDSPFVYRRGPAPQKDSTHRPTG